MASQCDQLQMMSYSKAAEKLDKYFQILETAVLESFKDFCGRVVLLFKEKYIFHPIEREWKPFISINASREFPGCDESMDSQH